MPASFHTTTTTQLLDALLDPADQLVWAEFDARYRPIIHALACRLGLHAEDAADVAQTTLSQFVRDYRSGRYERERGRLKSWILGIARHRITDALRQRARQGHQRGESAIAELPGDEKITQIWERERSATILDRAMSILRASTKSDDRTIRAFELVALMGVPADAVASDCQISVAEVYRIKHRITRRLRDLTAELSRAYLEGEE